MMILDVQMVMNFVLGGSLAVVGWLARQLWEAVQTLKQDVQRIELLLPSRYVEKVDFQLSMAKIDSKLDRVLDKLDGKQDKPHP